MVRRVPSAVVWIGFVALCNATGIVSALVGGNAEVYRELAKPSWAPPSWVFGPVWTMLYTVMGTATWLVWRQARDRGRIAGVFGIQLLTNFLWTPIFFGLQRFDLALIVIAMNLVALVAMAVVYGRQHRVAGWLVVPIIAWVAFATALNLALWRMNIA